MTWNRILYFLIFFSVFAVSSLRIILPSVEHIRRRQMGWAGNGAICYLYPCNGDHGYGERVEVFSVRRLLSGMIGEGVFLVFRNRYRIQWYKIS
jgi:hypothetical protein